MKLRSFLILSLLSLELVGMEQPSKKPHADDSAAADLIYFSQHPIQHLNLTNVDLPKVTEVQAASKTTLTVPTTAESYTEPAGHKVELSKLIPLIKNQELKKTCSKYLQQANSQKPELAIPLALTLFAQFTQVKSILLPYGGIKGGGQQPHTFLVMKNNECPICLKEIRDKFPINHFNKGDHQNFKTSISGIQYWLKCTKHPGNMRSLCGDRYTKGKPCKGIPINAPLEHL